MQKYRDINRDSGIDSYELGEDRIYILFKKGSARNYLYNYEVTGYDHIETMKILAANGDGLNSYINKHKPKYASKK